MQQTWYYTSPRANKWLDSRMRGTVSPKKSPMDSTARLNQVITEAVTQATKTATVIAMADDVTKFYGNGTLCARHPGNSRTRLTQ